MPEDRMTLNFGCAGGRGTPEADEPCYSMPHANQLLSGKRERWQARSAGRSVPSELNAPVTGRAPPLPHTDKQRPTHKKCGRAHTKNDDRRQKTVIEPEKEMVFCSAKMASPCGARIFVKSGQWVYVGWLSSVWAS